METGGKTPKDQNRWKAHTIAIRLVQTWGSFRFYRRLHVFPGLTVNLSKSGPSLTVGVRGAHVTVGRRGVTRTVGIPGSGIFYTQGPERVHHTGVHSDLHREYGELYRDSRFPRWLLGTIVLALAILALSLLRRGEIAAAVIC